MNRDLYENTIGSLKKRLKIALIVILVLCVSNVWLWVVKDDSSADNKESHAQTFEYLDPAANLLKSEDAIVNVQPLRDALRSMVEARTDENISVYFEYLPTGANININPELKIWPVSLAKLPIAMVAMKKIEKGDWSMDTKLKVLPDDINQGSGELYKYGAGIEYTVKDLLTELITNSDNTAYRVLKRLTTESERQEIVDNIGLGELFAENGKVSSKEYSRLLRTLFVASYLDQEHSNILLGLMTNNKFHDFINKGLQGQIFAHKQGENIQYNVYADSGIVYIEHRPYILSVMVQSKNKPYVEAKAEAAAFMAKVGNETLNYIKAY